MEHHARKLRSEFNTFLAGQDFTHAVTLKPNYQSTLATDNFLRSAFRRFHRDVDQILLGSRFNTPEKSAARSLAFGIVEGLPRAGHIHGLFRIANERWDDFEALFRPLDLDRSINPKRLNPWGHRVVGGTSVVERLYDADGWAGYSTKYLFDADSYDRVMILPEL